MSLWESNKNINLNIAENGSVAVNNNSGSIHIHNTFLLKSLDYKDIIATVLKLYPDDWHYNSDTETLMCDHDIRLQIRRDQEDFLHRLSMPWVKKFIDPIAYQDVYRLYYDNTEIKKYFFAIVDGGRMIIPYPTSRKDLTITPEEYHIGRLLASFVCASGDLDDYLGQAEISIET